MIKLFHRKYGQGQPLIILHGLFGSSDNWHSLAKRWGERFSVYTLDLRNHGSSPHESEMNYSIMASDLNQFLMDQRIEGAALLGHSMGGKVAMQFASKHPDKVAALAVLDIGVSKTEGKHDHILEALKHIHPEDFSSREDIQHELERYVKATQVLQFLMKNILRKVDQSFSWKFNRDVLLETYPLLSSPLELSESYMGPTLFLRGQNSGYLENEMDPEILQYFPLAILQTIENAGHWLHAEQPDQIFERISDFFE